MSEDEARELARRDWAAGLDLGNYDVPVTVCVTHKRFVPCRKGNEDCEWSSAPGDIGMVRWWQRGMEKP
jgi:hypothetical protein